MPDERRYGYNSTLKRGRSLLATKAAPARKTKLRTRSAKQSAREMDQFGPHAEHIRKKPCDICLLPPRNSAHHTLPRKRGGLARDLVSLCGSGTTGCHGEVENPPKHWTSENISMLKRLLSERAAYHWERSPFRHLYCAGCGWYKGKRKACRNLKCTAGIGGNA